jgi:hypothetical protein
MYRTNTYIEPCDFLYPYRITSNSMTLTLSSFTIRIAGISSITVDSRIIAHEEQRLLSYPLQCLMRFTTSQALRPFKSQHVQFFLNPHSRNVINDSRFKETCEFVYPYRITSDNIHLKLKSSFSLSQHIQFFYDPHSRNVINNS